MYLLSLDLTHVILTSLFLLMSLRVVFFRYKKYRIANKKSLNYTSNKNLITLRIASLVLSVVFLSIAFLEPTGLIKDAPGSVKGIDCIWLLDVSSSMDTEDVTENNSPISRLTKAKSVIENYIISHPENRYGLIIFAGKSRLVSPLTSEHGSMLSFLASIDSKSMAEGGTDFRDALTLATERFESSENTPHTIVLLSDGGDAEDAPDMDSIRNIFPWKHTSLITLGMGQTKPSPIPVGHDPLGNTVYKKFQGETVLSGLNRQTLKSLAETGNGSFLEGNSLQKDLEKFLASISRRTIQDSWDNSLDATVRILVAASFFLLLIFLLLPSSFLKQWNAS